MILFQLKCSNPKRRNIYSVGIYVGITGYSNRSTKRLTDLLRNVLSYISKRGDIK